MHSMNSRELSGVIPILPTPFTPEGAVDEVAFCNVIDTAITDGVDGLAMFGLASEYAKLSDTERTRLTNILIQQTAKRVPVIISITHHSLEVARSEAIAAVRAGADALMILPPFFMAPSVESVQNHIVTIAAENDVPIVVQYAPIQTGASLTADTCAAISQIYPNFAYVKVDLIPSGPMISRLKSLSSGSLQAIVGYMGLHLPEDVSRGAVAVMPTVSVSLAFVKLFRLLRDDPARGRHFHQRLLPLLNYMMQSVEMLIAVEKLLLQRRGILKSTYCRSPRWVLDSPHLAELEILFDSLQDLFPSVALMGGVS